MSQTPEILYKCGLCNKSFDYGYMADKQLCCFCRENCDRNNMVEHPITKEPFKRCVCGKIWNSLCAIDSLTIPATGDINYVPHGPKK